MKIPKAAQNLIDTAITNGWSYAVEWRQDISGTPFVTVKVGASRDRFDCTWHTRDTGTLRLFGRPLDRGQDRYVTLSTVLDTIIARPQEWVLEAAT